MSLHVERNQKSWQYTSTWKRRQFYCSVWEMCDLIRKYKLICNLKIVELEKKSIQYELQSRPLLFSLSSSEDFFSLGINSVKGYTLERIVTAGLTMSWFSVSTLKQFIFYSIYNMVNPVTTLLLGNKSMLSDKKRREQKLDHSFLVSSRACLLQVALSPGILLWYAWAT